MRPRIALLDASHGDSNTVRNFRRELYGTLAEFPVVDGRLPATFDFDAVVVSGSRSSVYDDEPWIDDTRTWVREAIARDVPTLGICWGHQLLADALGGTVEPMGEYELGYQTVCHDGESDLLAGIDEEFLVFTSHSDRVAELPPGATQFAENEYGIHGFRKDRVFGVQFHPEYDMETAKTVSEGKSDELSEKRIAEVVDGITPENYASACEAKRLFDNFCSYVDEKRRIPVG